MKLRLQLLMCLLCYSKHLDKKHTTLSQLDIFLPKKVGIAAFYLILTFNIVLLSFYLRFTFNFFF